MQTDLPILAIADTHGHLDLFKRAIDQAIQILGHTNMIVVTLGDHIDNGPQIPQYLDYLTQFKRDNSNYNPIIGNHEVYTVNVVKREMFKANEGRHWMYWQKCFSMFYTPTFMQYGAFDEKSYIKKFPETHLNFIQNLPWYLQINNFVFVHCGLIPEYNEPISSQFAFLDKKDLSGFD